MNRKDEIKDYLKREFEKQISNHILEQRKTPIGKALFNEDAIIFAIVDHLTVFKFSMYERKEQLAMSKSEIDNFIEEISDKMVRIYVDGVEEN